MIGVLRTWIVPTLTGYRRSWLTADLIAGVTLAAIALPEQMATAGLVHVAPVVGLYAFVAGSLAIAAFGASRQMSVGADSTIAPILAAGAVAVAAVGTPQYAAAVALVSLLVGAIVLVAGLARLGWIANFLSVPVLRGMLAGIGIEIAVRQLPAVLGLPGGGESVVSRLRHVVDQRGQVNGWTVGIAVAVVVVVVAAEGIDRRLPGALVAAVGATAAVAIGDLSTHGVRIIGALNAHAPHWAFPTLRSSQLAAVAGAALTAGFIAVIQTAATAQQAGTASGTTAELDRDLIGVGAGGLVAAVGGTFAVNASPPRTAAVLSAGGRSQASSLFAAGFVVVAVVFGSTVIRDLPVATLGAILLLIAGRLIRIRLLVQVWRFSRVEFGLAATAALAVALVGIEQGVLTAIVLSLAYRTRLAARPADAVLGREIGTDHWVRPGSTRTEQVDAVLVYDVGGPLWFGDAQFVADRIRRQIDRSPRKPTAFVLDAAAVPDVDYTGSLAFAALVDDLHHRGISVAVARAVDGVRRSLTSHVPAGSVRFFANVEAAVEGATSPPRPPAQPTPPVPAS
jgi:SulP family sulfate permease